jgi:hypothetical protein
LARVVLPGLNIISFRDDPFVYDSGGSIFLIPSCPDHYGGSFPWCNFVPCNRCKPALLLDEHLFSWLPFYFTTYSKILVTTPAPTVRPPSRMAKFCPCSSATGTISSTSRFTSSPGMTISIPSGRAMFPVTSIVLM